MRKIDRYTSTIDTIFAVGHNRETLVRDAGDIVGSTPRSEASQSTFVRVIERFSRWHTKRASRLTLSELSDEQLRDIGITREQAKDEVSKSFFPRWSSHPL